MLIRPWKYEDVLRIAALEKECFPNEPWSYGTLASSFGADGFSGVVAEDGGEIIGYGSFISAADTADVERIAVSESFRRGGVAKAMVCTLLRAAEEKGVIKLFLEVRVSNAAAMGLYIKCGFKGVYARPRYYPDGEDCLVMVKEL